MRKNCISIMTLFLLSLLFQSSAFCQTREQGVAIFEQAGGLAHRASSKEDLQNALKKYEEAMVIFERVGTDADKGSTFLDAGMVCFLLSQYQKALVYYGKCLEITKKIGSVPNEANTLLYIGNVYLKQGQYQRALEYYEKSAPMKQKLGDVVGEAAVLSSIGSVYLQLSQYQKALDYYDKSLIIEQKIGNVRGEGSNLGNIGLVYAKLGQYQKALDYYDKALKLDQKMGYVTGEALTLGNIGNVYSNLGQYQKALDYYEKSLLMKKKIGDIAGEANTLGNIGLVYSNLGQYQKGLDYYEKSLIIEQKIGNVAGEAQTLGHIGSVYSDLGQYQKAIDYQEKSLLMKQKIGDVAGEASTLANIGNVYTHLGQYQKALGYYDKSLSIKQKVGDVSGEATILGNIGSIYLSMSQYDKALEQHEKSLLMKQKIGDVAGEASTLVNIGAVHANLGQHKKSFDYYKKSLAIVQEIGDVAEEAGILGRIGLVYSELGQYQQALDLYEKALRIEQKVGDAAGEARTLGRIGMIYNYLGQYQKALVHCEKSLVMEQKIGDVLGEAMTLGNIENIYTNMGQYQKALENLERCLTISQKIGNAHLEANTFYRMGSIYTQLGKFDDALINYQFAQDVFSKIGAPTALVIDSIGNLYMDRGESDKAESYLEKSKDLRSYARFYLLRSDYELARGRYEKVLALAEKNQNADNLFIAYTGLGKVCEALNDYNKSEEYYQKAMVLTEELRSRLLPSERKNFFEVKIGGFYRNEPAKGLTRIRMKLNRPYESIEPSEMTRARAFSDVISSRSEGSVSGIPKEILGKENALVSKVASLKKELAKTDREKQADRFQNLNSEIQSAQSDLNSFIEDLWSKYPPYAAVKYPRPVTLRESKLGSDEQIVVFDVSTEGVGVKLIKDKQITQTFYTDWKSEELERDVTNFRQPLEQLKLTEFDPDLGNALYKRLLSPVIDHLPAGVPLIIIPDGILATLPFEALVVDGNPTWKKIDTEWPDSLKDYPDGLTFLGDVHPISYYQSITALTLARATNTKNKENKKLLVMADPVFDMSDQRIQGISHMKPLEQDKTNDVTLMQTIEDASQGRFRLKRLSKTTEMAGQFQQMYGENCLSLTGLKANKSDFLTKIAPDLERYSDVVFATHGVISTHVPGLMEPFLALTMIPPGTDGFLKMSDVMSLKMNAEIVALTACQTGLGKDLSGEGVMSMGRAFQYAGAKSVLMSLWSVSEAGSALLTEKFFQHLKTGKSKLDALHAARNDIRAAGYKHPFFWSAFVLVGEAY